MGGNHEQPTVEIDPREIVHAYIERERAEWLPHYRHALRDGRMNAELNRSADEAFKPIDKLLDELNRLGRSAVAQVVDRP